MTGPTVTMATVFPLPRRTAFALAFASGLFYWLAFAGMDIWVFAFVAFAPLWIALQNQTEKTATWLGVTAGATMNVFGFYWLLNMLRTFSGFPTPLCMFFTFVVCVYQGGRIGLLGWLYARATTRGWPAAPVFVLAFAASELVYPLLFPWYFGATLHDVPLLAQLSDLGGPILVGLVPLLVSVALAEPVLARLTARKPDRRILATGAVALALALAYGTLRVRSVDARVAEAPSVHVGVVQGNMGLFQKREDPGEGLRRHVRLTDELKKAGAELVVWSESSVTFPVPERMKDDFMKKNVAQKLGVPAIFGAVLYRVDPDRERWFNTALSSDPKGNIVARYDKEYLLAFGEYLPFGETFPILHQWSPNSGKFSAGTELTPLVMLDKDGRSHKVTTLICYEDILPSFTNRAVTQQNGETELLVNITNDAWFGATTEPWEHLALAQLRAIEHRRYLVRSTNSGVSAIVDPVGRVVAHSNVEDVQHGSAPDGERLDAVVHWMRAHTVYETLGDMPWWIAAFATFLMAFVRRSRPEGTGTPAAASS